MQCTHLFLPHPYLKAIFLFREEDVSDEYFYPNSKCPKISYTKVANKMAMQTADQDQTAPKGAV